MLSELHDAYFIEPTHAQKVLAQLRFKQAARTLVDVKEVCYLLTKEGFASMHAMLPMWRNLYMQWSILIAPIDLILCNASVLCMYVDFIAFFRE